MILMDGDNFLHAYLVELFTGGLALKSSISCLMTFPDLNAYKTMSNIEKERIADDN